MIRRFHQFLFFLLLLLCGTGVYFLFGFTAEDAFITYRYAENFANTGALVFNSGEAINALTSPLHALISAGLFSLTGRTLLANKIVGFALLLAALVLVSRRFTDRPMQQFLALALLAPSSCVLLWTFGGLETPILLFLVTATALFLLRRSTARFDFARLMLLFVSAGLAFLLRYDSILFFLPALIQASLKARSFRHLLLASFMGALPPLCWLAVSAACYGDLLPTSFYVKTPSLNFLILLKNGAYIACQFLYTGLIPALLLPLFLRGRKRIPVTGLRRHLATSWWLPAGIALELLYGCTVATTHMMFSFRFFVPYLPSAVILAAELIGGETDASGHRQEMPRSMQTGIFRFGFCLLLFQGYLLYHTFTASVNGISFIGEYRKLGVADYEKFLDLLSRESQDLDNHWKSVAMKEHRPPRIHTFAAGVLPYTLRDAQIFERLISYRRNAPADYDSLNKFAADYIHLLTPRHGPIREQLPKPEEEYQLISKHEMEFDGSLQKFLIYYNPHPESRIPSNRSR